MIRDPSDGSVRKRREMPPPDAEMIEISREAERQRAREERSRNWLQRYRSGRLPSSSEAAE